MNYNLFYSNNLSALFSFYVNYTIYLNNLYIKKKSRGSPLLFLLYTFLDWISAIFSSTSLALSSFISVYPSSLKACILAVFNS